MSCSVVVNRGLVATAAALLWMAAVAPAQAQSTDRPVATTGVRYVNGASSNAASGRSNTGDTGLPYNLRLVFVEGHKHADASGIQLNIRDAQGRVVLNLPDAGPMTDIHLPDGHYAVNCQRGQTTRQDVVDLKDGQPLNLYLHFPRDKRPP